MTFYNNFFTILSARSMPSLIWRHVPQGCLPVAFVIALLMRVPMPAGCWAAGFWSGFTNTTMCIHGNSRLVYKHAPAGFVRC